MIEICLNLPPKHLFSHSADMFAPGAVKLQHSAEQLQHRFEFAILELRVDAHHPGAAQI